jgi:hypothetical protein
MASLSNDAEWATKSEGCQSNGSLAAVDALKGPILSGGLSFRLGCTVHHVVRIAQIISKAQRFSGNAFFAEVTELILEPHATACEFKLDEPLSNQKAMNRSQ